MGNSACHDVLRTLASVMASPTKRQPSHERRATPSTTTSRRPRRCIASQRGNLCRQLGNSTLDDVEPGSPDVLPFRMAFTSQLGNFTADDSLPCSSYILRSERQRMPIEWGNSAPEDFLPGCSHSLPLGGPILPHNKRRHRRRFPGGQLGRVGPRVASQSCNQAACESGALASRGFPMRPG